MSVFHLKRNFGDEEGRNKKSIIACNFRFHSIWSWLPLFDEACMIHDYSVELVRGAYSPAIHHASMKSNNSTVNHTSIWFHPLCQCIHQNRIITSIFIGKTTATKKQLKMESTTCTSKTLCKQDIDAPRSERILK